MRRRQKKRRRHLSLLVKSNSIACFSLYVSRHVTHCIRIFLRAQIPLDGTRLYRASDAESPLSHSLQVRIICINRELIVLHSIHFYVATTTSLTMVAICEVGGASSGGLTRESPTTPLPCSPLRSAVLCFSILARERVTQLQLQHTRHDQPLSSTHRA